MQNLAEKILTKRINLKIGTICFYLFLCKIE